MTQRWTSTNFPETGVRRTRGNTSPTTRQRGSRPPTTEMENGRGGLEMCGSSPPRKLHSGSAKERAHQNRPGELEEMPEAIDRPKDG